MKLSPYHLKQRPLALAITALFASLPLAAQAQPSAPAEDTLPAIQARAKFAKSLLSQPVQTGSKTDTPLQDLPASVVVVPQETLRSQGVTDLNRALQNVSGATPLFGGGYGFANNYTIRGLSVVFLRDGLRDASTQNGYWRTMADVEQIEVLKGPGSALYGSTGPGGAINLVSKIPQAKFGTEVTGWVGSFGTVGERLDITGPLSSSVQGRAIYNHEESQGFRGLSRHIQEFMPTLSWQIMDDKRLTLDVDYRDIQVKPDPYGIQFGSDKKPANVPIDTRYYSPMNDSRQRIERTSLTHDWQINADLALKTVLLQETRHLTLTRNAGSSGGNAAGVITGRTLRQQWDSGQSQLVQNELIWKTRQAGIENTVLVGMEYGQSTVDTRRVSYTLPNIVNLNNPVVPESTTTGLPVDVANSFNRRLQSTNVAFYGQEQIALGEQWKIRAGLRSERAAYSDKGSQGAVAYRDISVQDTLNTGNLGAVFQPMRNVSLFAGYSTGKFVNLATESNAVPLTPESSEQKEIGLKVSQAQLGVDAQLAAYEVKRSDYFITLPGALNATPDGKDKTRGVELDLNWRATSRLAFLFNTYRQNASTESNALASNAILGITNQSIQGLRPVGTAKQGGKLWASYHLQNGVQAGPGWQVGSGITWKGDTYADSLNQYQVAGYQTWDAAIRYTQVAWDISLNLNNLSNKRYYVSSSNTGALPAETRNAMLTVRYRFK